jgi:predicted dehydrogenase
MTQEIIRVGIVGAGANTVQRHIPGLLAMGDVDIVGVCNRSVESSERVAEEFGIRKTYEHWQEAVEDPDTHAIVVGTWPYMHCPVTVAALDEGKHILTEARMAMNAREAREMLIAARENPGLVAQVVPSPYTLAVDATVQRLLAEGYVGDVLAIDVVDGGSFLDRDAPLHWRHDFDLSGLNIMSMGIYYEALLRWVGGASRVLAMGKTFVKSRLDADGHRRSVRIPEHLDITADLVCGAQLHMQISSVTGFEDGAGLTIFGSDGMLRFRDGKLYGAQRGDEGPAEIAIPDSERGGWRVEEEFINAIRGSEAVTCTTFELGVQYMEFTEAVSLSMAGGRAIHLPLELDA